MHTKFPIDSEISRNASGWCTIATGTFENVLSTKLQDLLHNNLKSAGFLSFGLRFRLVYCHVHQGAIKPFAHTKSNHYAYINGK